MVWTWLFAVAASIGWVLIRVARNPDRAAPAMNAAWPLLALYFGPGAVALYAGLAGDAQAAWRRLPWRHRLDLDPQPPWPRALWAAVHCAAGCAAGDLVAMAGVRGGGLFGGGMVFETAVAAAVAFGVGGVAFRAAPLSHAATLAAYLVGQMAVMHAFHDAGSPAMGFEPRALMAMQAAMAAGFVTAVLVGRVLATLGHQGPPDTPRAVR